MARSFRWTKAVTDQWESSIFDRLPRPRIALPLAVALLLVGCSSTAGTEKLTPASPVARTKSTVQSSPSASRSSTPAISQGLKPPTVPGLTWHPAGSVVAGVPVTYLATTARGAVGLLWINPLLASFRLVPGTKVPEGGPAVAADGKPSTWVPNLVAAFNGGFLLKDRVGGYYNDHRMVSPLTSNLAALVITSDGKLSVGLWERDFQLTTKTVTVRQNLRLLVDHNKAATSAFDTPRTWGIANGGLWTANRSALGERPDGSLVYAYGHETTAAKMAEVLVGVGVERAMVLDMNKSWPGGFVYLHTHAGIVGQRVHAQQYHSASVYYARYTKDFVAVLRR